MWNFCVYPFKRPCGRCSILYIATWSIGLMHYCFFIKSHEKGASSHAFPCSNPFQTTLWLGLGSFPYSCMISTLKHAAALPRSACQSPSFFLLSKCTVYLSLTLHPGSPFITFWFGHLFVCPVLIIFHCTPIPLFLHTGGGSIFS